MKIITFNTMINFKNQEILEHDTLNKMVDHGVGDVYSNFLPISQSFYI